VPIAMNTVNRDFVMGRSLNRPHGLTTDRPNYGLLFLQPEGMSL